MFVSIVPDANNSFWICYQEETFQKAQNHAYRLTSGNKYDDERHFEVVTLYMSPLAYDRWFKHKVSQQTIKPVQVSAAVIDHFKTLNNEARKRKVRAASNSHIQIWPLPKVSSSGDAASRR